MHSLNMAPVKADGLFIDHFCHTLRLTTVDQSLSCKSEVGRCIDFGGLDAPVLLLV